LFTAHTSDRSERRGLRSQDDYRRKAIVQLLFSTEKRILKYRSAKINTWTTPRLLSLRSADSPPVLNSDHTLLSTRFYAIYPKNIISKSSVDFLKPLGESCRF
jgi:hypothetical protein